MKGTAELWLTVQREIESRRKGRQTARSESSAPLKVLFKCGYYGCAMIPTYSGKKVSGPGTFHYYRCKHTRRTWADRHQVDFRQEALEARIRRHKNANVENPVRLSFSTELRLGYGESVFRISIFEQLFYS